MLACDQDKFRRFFQEAVSPIWQSRVGRREGDEEDIVKYGTFDSDQFSELELRMYVLIKARLATMQELKTCYTLTEALKLYALYSMELDIERGKAEEIEDRRNGS